MAENVASINAIVQRDSKDFEVGLISDVPLPPTCIDITADGEDDSHEHDDHSKLLVHGESSTSKFAASAPTHDAKVQGIPLFAWALLFASLVAVSSAAVVFASIPDVPTFALAAWRLQLTTLLLTPAAVYQFRQLTQGICISA